MARQGNLFVFGPREGQMQGMRNWRRRIAVAAILALGGLAAACGQSDKPAQQALNGSKSPVPSETATPAAAAPAASPSYPELQYTVVTRGQTLYQIARAHHVPMTTVAAANSLKPPYLLRIGFRLALPRLGPWSPNLASATTVSSPDQASTATTQVSAAPALPEKPYVVAFYEAPKDGVVQPLQVQTLVGPDLPEAPSVLAPRNPAAALPLPGENP